VPKRIRSLCGTAYGYIDEDGDYVLFINSVWRYIFPDTWNVSGPIRTSDACRTIYNQTSEQEYAVIDISLGRYIDD